MNTPLGVSDLILNVTYSRSAVNAEGSQTLLKKKDGVESGRVLMYGTDGSRIIRNWNLALNCNNKGSIQGKRIQDYTELEPCVKL